MWVRYRVGPPRSLVVVIDSVNAATANFVTRNMLGVPPETNGGCDARGGAKGSRKLLRSNASGNSGAVGRFHGRGDGADRHRPAGGEDARRYGEREGRRDVGGVVGRPLARVRGFSAR